MKTYLAVAFGCLLSLAVVAQVSSAAEEAAPAKNEDAKIALADGQFWVRAPQNWVRKRPAVNIIEHEFAVPASEGDAADGRLTVMNAGGSIDDNVNRWFGQFTQPDGGSTADRAKVKKIQVNGEDVHLIDISGTFKDQRGPFAPAVEREKYRMLGAIVATKKFGNYFFKFYGPQRTVTENEEAFVKMIEGLQRK